MKSKLLQVSAGLASVALLATLASGQIVSAAENDAAPQQEELLPGWSRVELSDKDPQDAHLNNLKRVNTDKPTLYWYDTPAAPGKRIYFFDDTRNDVYITDTAAETTFDVTVRLKDSELGDYVSGEGYTFSFAGEHDAPIVWHGGAERSSDVLYEYDAAKRDQAEFSVTVPDGKQWADGAKTHKFAVAKSDKAIRPARVLLIEGADGTVSRHVYDDDGVVESAVKETKPVETPKVEEPKDTTKAPVVTETPKETEKDTKQDKPKQPQKEQHDDKQNDANKKAEDKQSGDKKSEDKQSDGKKSEDKQSDEKKSDGKKTEGKKSEDKQSEDKKKDAEEGGKKVAKTDDKKKADKKDAKQSEEKADAKKADKKAAKKADANAKQLPKTGFAAAGLGLGLALTGLGAALAVKKRN